MMKEAKTASGMGQVGAVLVVAVWLATPGAAGAGLTAIDRMEQAESQIRIALNHAEQSLVPHRVGSGWTREHMQRVINVLQGEQGTDFNGKIENPGDGYGAINHLKVAHDALRDHVDPKLVLALASASAYVEEAIEHAKRSIQGANVGDVHGQARLAAGMLVAALGSPDSVSPVTGALHYVENALLPVGPKVRQHDP